ncbi:tetratricopeptide repeat protein, partial [Myxococcota bacterium]|nr:tetratricopeptide repeat protein [Myxococcota bacterium]
VPMDAASVPRAVSASPAIDSRLLDPSLDIDTEVQRRILEFELSLSRPYHELLGVPVGADPKAVKRAYFKLSKEFHPDRYFRKQIGPYTARLERIFKKVLEAHEILSDPDLCQVENQGDPVVAEAVDPAVDAAGAQPIAAAGQAVVGSAAEARVAPTSGSSAKPASTSPAPSTTPPGAGPGTASSAPSAASAEKRPLTKLERLKQRMPFKIDQAAFAARRARAREIFQAAEASLEAGRLHEAEAGIRIAITFDPARPEFKEALGALRIRAAGDRAAKLLETPTDRMSEIELREVLRLLEDVLPYRPHDSNLNLRAAGVCLQLGRHDEAVEYVETLLETEPDVASHHSLLGRIERARGDLAAARRAFDRALEIDRDDLEARRAVASMRIAAHDAARGGRR